jgi:peptidoglycan hydrolase-like protein with peptidoglycan-binding domain
MRLLLTVLALLVSLAPLARADETVRQVQEELRKRNLYFGNVDGQISPVLIDALKRYQARKGFAVTGRVDNDTATSLHVKITVVAASQTLPDVPVLRSDTASVLPESERRALQRDAEEKGADLAPTPPPPAESPSLAQDLTPERVNKFVEDYLRDGETQDVASQVKYYAFPVHYFDHGSVSEEFVTKDTANYVKRWPERKYTLLGAPQFFAAGKEGETEIDFTISFELRSDGRKTKSRAAGRTKNWWTVRTEGDDLKIVTIREERLRE